MKNIREIATQVWASIDNNSPAILTALSVTGTVTTAVLTGRAVWQSYDAINLAEHKSAEAGYQELPLKGRIALVWPIFIPAVGVGLVTVACIIGANTVSSRRTAALATAYSLAERGFTEYKEKVEEHLTPAKRQKVQDEIAEDHIRTAPTRQTSVFQTGSGDHLCYDSLTGRYFRSNMESLRKGMNDVNQKMITSDGYASQNDLYDQWNLPRVGTGDDLGWTAEMPVDLQISTILSEEGEPTLHVGYTHLPIAKYYRQH